VLKDRWTHILIAMGTAALGVALAPLTPWYRGLERPWFQPPDGVFGPAWTLVFALSAAGFVRAGAGCLPAVLLALNGLLNAGWNLLFATLQRPNRAMIKIVPLWLSVLAMLLEARRHDRQGAPLIAPCPAQVTFAGCLNRAIFRLNAPFG